MGLAAKLLRHHRRLLRPFSSPFPPSAPLQNPSLISPFFFADESLIALNPGLRPVTSSRSFSWLSWCPPSDNGGEVAEGGPVGRSDLPSGHNPFGGSKTGVEPSSLGLDWSNPPSDDGSDVTGGGPVRSSDSEYNPVGGSQTGAEPPSLGLDGSGIVEEVAGESVWNYPMRAVISLLDGYHEFSGFPWWVIISTSALAVRLSLLPVLILQLRKAQEISLFLPKLPPPFPPPLSGRSFREQYMLFKQKRRELGCPTYLWNFAFFAVQVPCFVLWTISIRRMCLDSHPGFNTGGALWFYNLTDFPSGIFGATLPLMIAGLHTSNVQISFEKIGSRNLPGVLGKLAKYFRFYMDIMAIPLLLIAFQIPQGSLVYWTTNSFLTLLQQLSLKNSYIRMKLGLPDEKGPLRKQFTSENVLKGPLRKQVISENVLPEKNVHLGPEISVDALSPQRLLDLALEDIAAGRNNKAIPFLEKAIQKDPELVRALIAMGQILCSKGSLVESAKYFEDAISKIHDKEDTLLVVATFGAGVSHLWQGNKLEGIRHLKRIAELKEPDDPADKACYHRGLVVLGSTLFQEGQKSEAAKYLRIAAAYDPAVNAYIKECEGEG